ncbi:hypothetical protein A2U01_0109898, partial [Trifolium medium]|nr:hypothetical protein [Trifolium medium]
MATPISIIENEMNDGNNGNDGGNSPFVCPHCYIHF